MMTRRLPLFTAKVYQTDLPHPRFGFVVSKKVSASAVVRNRVKRQFRGAIEAILPQIRSGYDILFIVQKEVLGSEAEAMRASLLRFLTDEHLII
jgi:ribonuclease P protein component